MQGPFEIDELISLHAFSEDLPVCMENRQDWMPAARVADLAPSVELLRSRRNSPPPVPPRPPERPPSLTPLQGNLFGESNAQGRLFDTDGPEPGGGIKACFTFAPVGDDSSGSVQTLPPAVTTPIRFLRTYPVTMQNLTAQEATTVAESPIVITRPMIYPDSKPASFSDAFEPLQKQYYGPPASRTSPIPMEMQEPDIRFDALPVFSEPFVDFRPQQAVASNSAFLEGWTADSAFNETTAGEKKSSLWPWALGLLTFVFLVMSGFYLRMNQASSRATRGEAPSQQQPMPGSSSPLNLDAPPSVAMPVNDHSASARNETALLNSTVEPSPSRAVGLPADRPDSGPIETNPNTLSNSAAPTKSPVPSSPETKDAARNSSEPLPKNAGRTVASDGAPAMPTASTLKKLYLDKWAALARPATKQLLPQADRHHAGLSSFQGLVLFPAMTAASWAATIARLIRSQAKTSSGAINTAANVVVVPTVAVVSATPNVLVVPVAGLASVAVSHSVLNDSTQKTLTDPSQGMRNNTPQVQPAHQKIPATGRVKRTKKPLSANLDKAPVAALQKAQFGGLPIPVAPAPAAKRVEPAESPLIKSAAPVVALAPVPAAQPASAAIVPSNFPKPVPVTSGPSAAGQPSALPPVVLKPLDPWAGRQNEAIALVRNASIIGGKSTIDTEAKSMLGQMHQKEILHAANTGERLFLPDKVSWSALRQEGVNYLVYLTFSALQADGTRMQNTVYRFQADLQQKMVSSDDPVAQQDFFKAAAPLVFRHDVMADDIELVLGAVDQLDKQKLRAMIIEKDRRNKKARDRTIQELSSAQGKLNRNVIYFRQRYADKILQNVAKAYNFIALLVTHG